MRKTPESVGDNLFIGTSGWSYADWAGIVYPARRSSGFSDLTYLSQFFDAVEINTSFYRPPTTRMCAKWVERTAENPRFTFTAKLWRRFTHERSQAWTVGEVLQFKDGMRPLCEAEKLGALLVQFPWSFSTDAKNMDWIERIADAFAEFHCVVEVRHASWNRPDALDFLRRRRMGFCNIDQPSSSKGIGPTNIAVGPLAYYRFHGRNREAWFNKDAGRDARYDYLYNEGELAPWVKNIETMLEEGEKVFVMNNNHYRGQAAVNALQLKSRLRKKKVRVPAPLLERYPVLGPIALPLNGQGRLPF